jgi:hypothetical protein
MSCFNNYLPQTTNEWSRVRKICYNETDNTVLGYTMQMLKKGNVLQHQSNSIKLTNTQKYSKIAQRKWVNRNKSWASQSFNGYSDPNTFSLKRTGIIVNIAIDPITGIIIGPTTEPITCPETINIINEGLPPNNYISNDIPDTPTQIDPAPNTIFFPDIVLDTPSKPIIIPDGGSLICSVQEFVCDGKTKYKFYQPQCNPTTDSDVPGTIQQLCWDERLSTWNPRQNYSMPTANNKWPTNAILNSANNN